MGARKSKTIHNGQVSINGKTYIGEYYINQSGECIPHGSGKLAAESYTRYKDGYQKGWDVVSDKQGQVTCDGRFRHGVYIERKFC
jgi:hypothetical protein